MKTWISKGVMSGAALAVAVVMLLNASCSVLAPNDALNKAAYDGKLAEVQKLVKANPKLATEKAKDGRTALMQAALTGQVEIAKFLIEKGAGVNTTDNDGKTALHGAIVNGHKEMVDLLLEKGADPTVQVGSLTPLMMAQAKKNQEIIAAIEKAVDEKAKAEQAANGGTPAAPSPTDAAPTGETPAGTAPADPSATTPAPIDAPTADATPAGTDPADPSPAETN